MTLTNFSNITTFAGFLQEANNQTGGWFWTGMNFLVFMVLFITLTTGFGWEAGLFSAGFVSIIISVFLMYLGLQSMLLTGATIAIILIVYIIIMWSNKYD
jgi:hypothetical protein